VSEQADETSEIVRAGMRTALMVAAQLAQRTIRAHEQQLRDREAASLQRAAELQARFDAERAAAVAALTPVGRDDWWQTASQQNIADMYQTARTWEDFDLTARQAADRIRREVDGRYGIDAASLEREADLVREASAERDRAQVEQAAAVVIATDAEADRAERDGAETAYQVASEVRADELWDSADRRTDRAASLQGGASAEAVRARMLADTGQGARARGAIEHRAVESALPGARPGPGPAPHPKRARVR